MLNELRPNITAKPDQIHLGTLFPGKLHGRYKVTVTSDKNNYVHLMLQGEGSYIEPDTHVHTLLLYVWGKVSRCNFYFINFLFDQTVLEFPTTPVALTKAKGIERLTWELKQHLAVSLSEISLRIVDLLSGHRLSNRLIKRGGIVIIDAVEPHLFQLVNGLQFVNKGRHLLSTGRVFPSANPWLEKASVNEKRV